MSTIETPQRAETTLLSLSELAHRWKVSKRTIETLVASGELPSVNLTGRTRRVRESDAATYLADRIGK